MAQKRLVWSPRASSEFKDILEYYVNRNRSATYSLKLIETVDAMVELLLKHPFLGRMSNNGETRVISLGNYLLFYDENEEEVSVVSFWDNRQNPAKRVDG